MAYFKRRRQAQRRRASRARLSTRRIYGNTSAKSQAHQIYALRRRVNKVYSRCKPEYKVYSGLNQTFTFSSGNITNTFQLQYFNGPTLGTEDNHRVGNHTNSVSLDIYFTGEYWNTSNTGYHDSESAGTPFRIIILQRKIPSYDSVSPVDILSTTGGSGADYTMQAICPLVKNITENFRVLADKKYVFTSARNQVLDHIKVKPNNFRWDGDNNCNGIIIFLVSAGLHADANFTEYIKGTSKLRYVWTDP